MNPTSLSFHKTGGGEVTLSQLMGTLGKEKTKYNNKSLRLHVEEGNENVQMKVHKKLSGVNSEDRKIKKELATRIVKSAIQKEFNGHEGVGERLLTRICKRPEKRISLGELKKLQEAVTGSKTALETILSKCLSPGKTSLGVIEGALEILSKDFTSSNDVSHFVNAQNLKDSPVLSKLAESLRKASPEEAQTTVKKISEAIRFMETKMQKFQGEVQNSSARVLPALRSLLNNVIKQHVSQCLTKDLELYGKSDKVKWEKNFENRTVQIKKLQENLKVESKEGSFKNVPPQLTGISKEKWEPAVTGLNGTLIIKDKSLQGGGAVFKMETELSGKASIKTSEYISNVKMALAKKGIDLPVGGMEVHKIDLAGKELQEHLGSVFKNAQEKFPERFEGRTLAKNKFDDYVSNKDTTNLAIVCDFVENATDVDKLPLRDRFVLCKTDPFPQDLGKAMVLGTVFGLGDHVGIRHGAFQPPTNLANLMMNNDTGKLVFIDYAHTPGKRLNGESGYSAQMMDLAFKNLENLIKDVAGKSEGMMGRLQQVLNSKDSAVAGVTGALFRPEENDGQGTLFNTSESLVPKDHLTDMDKTRFVANLLLGAIESMKLVGENQDVFLSGEPMFDEPKVTLENIGKISEGLKTMENNLRDYLKN